MHVYMLIITLITCTFEILDRPSPKLSSITSADPHIRVLSLAPLNNEESRVNDLTFLLPAVAQFWLATNGRSK